VRGGNLAVCILNQMQVLYQQVAAAWPLAEQLFDLMCRLRIDLAALGSRFGAPPAFAWMFE
jgi:hypothetical protein